MSSTPHPVVVGLATDQPTVVQYAVAEARRLGRALRVVHCWALPTVGAEYAVAAGTTAVLKADSDELLDRTGRLVSKIDAGLELELIAINAVTAGALAVEARTAAVIILGSDDVPWFERVRGGGLSSHLARVATCPVVFVPERGELAGTDRATWGVVVTINGETSAAGPLRYAFEQADVRGEPLHVLHAAPATTFGPGLTAHRASVAEVVAGWQEQFPSVEVVRSTSDGSASDASIRATFNASLLVMGQHHGHDTPLTMLWPVARTVLQGAHCPVVVVPLDFGADRPVVVV